LDSYVINIEEDVLKNKRYQITIYKNDYTLKVFDIKSDSFKEMLRYALGCKNAIEEHEHVKLPIEAVQISKSVIAKYVDVDEELKDFISNKQNYTVYEQDETIE